jgi:hypothetical protein
MVRPGDVIRASDISVQACKVTRTTNQSIPYATDTAVQFTSESFDTDGMHDNVTNNTRITINTAGIYGIAFSGTMKPPTGGPTNFGRIIASILVNGSAIALSQENPIDAAGELDNQMNISTYEQLDVGDYIEVSIYQTNDSSVARNLGGTNDWTPIFSAVRIGS